MITRTSLAGAALSVAALIMVGGTSIDLSSSDSEKKQAPSIWKGPARIGDWRLAPHSSAPDLNEDETGWNCYTNGDGSCGTDLMRKARGFITPSQTNAMPSDACIYYTDYPEYVMCRDGRVYLRGPGPLI